MTRGKIKSYLTDVNIYFLFFSTVNVSSLITSFIEIQLHLQLMYQILGEKGYTLHKQILELDRALGKTNNKPDDNMLSHKGENQNSLLLCHCVEQRKKHENVEEIITSYLYQKQENKDVNNNNENSYKDKKREHEIDSISKPSPFGGGNAMAEAVAEAARKKANLQKLNNNISDNDISSSSTSKPSPFGGGNAMAEAVAEAARKKANLQKLNNNNNTDKDDTSSFISTDFIYNDHLTDLASLSTLDLLNILIDVAYADMDNRSYDLSGYFCLYKVYSTKFLLSDEKYDKAQAVQLLNFCTEIIDHSNAVGMVGWSYGPSSLVLDRAMERPFEILSELASFHASIG